MFFNDDTGILERKKDDDTNDDDDDWNLLRLYLFI